MHGVSSANETNTSDEHDIHSIHDRLKSIEVDWLVVRKLSESPTL